MHVQIFFWLIIIIFLFFCMIIFFLILSFVFLSIANVFLFIFKHTRINLTFIFLILSEPNRISSKISGSYYIHFRKVEANPITEDQAYKNSTVSSKSSVTCPNISSHAVVGKMDGICYRFYYSWKRDLHANGGDIYIYIYIYI